MAKNDKNRLTIRILVDWVVSPYQNTILRGVADCALRNDVNLICYHGGSIHSSRKYEEIRNILYDLAYSDILDGLIILAAPISRYVDNGTIGRFCERFRPIPLITISHVLDSLPSLSVDNESGMRDLVNHLVDVHHYKHFAFIKGAEHIPDANERFECFRNLLKEKGIRLQESMIVNGDFTSSSGIRAVDYLFNDTNHKFDVIVAANDNMAFGVLDALTARGIRVPDEMAVTGFDNLNLSRYCSPPLTTVKQPLYEQGWTAVELLIGHMKGGELSGRMVVPSSLIVRESCGCVTASFPAYSQKGKEGKEKGNKTIERKREIIDAVIEKTEGLFKRRFSIDEKGLLKDICLDFLESIKSCDIDGFMRKFDLMIKNIQILGGDIFVLQQLVDGLKDKLLKVLNHHESLLCTEELGYRAYVLVSERMLQEEKYRHSGLLVENQRFNSLREDLHMMLEKEKQIEELKKRLPELGISECYLSFFSDRQNLIEGEARLLLAYDEKGPVLTVEKEKPFPAKKLVPETMPFWGKRFAVIVEVLNEIGFIVYELNIEMAQIYGFLSDNISSALQTSLLVNEVENQKNNLSEHLIKLRKAMSGFIQTMAQTVEVRDPYTFGHLHKVSDLARTIAQELKLDSNKVESIRMAGLVHDLGKIYVPSEVLNRPGKLDDIEFMMIKKHPQVGYDILKTIDFPWPIADIVYEHHEKLDGSGYPRGLKGDEISIEARIMTVADVVEAMSSHRPYREALGIDAALDEIDRFKGILYDPDVVDACIRLFREKGYTWTT
ncbi:MAG: substrate-binding domain-containing protein [Spirochaetales bacterium]|nr:substrate-binding domain-containing protein [Spirochaetales bacterium]